MVDCSDQLKIEQNIEADGYGSGGQGGTIQLEAPTIRMADQSTYLKHIRANGKPNGGGADGGTITLKVAAADFDQTHGIVAHRGQLPDKPADWHDIQALPSPSGSIQTSENENPPPSYRRGGNYDPAPVDLPVILCN